VKLNNALPSQSKEWYLAEGSTVWTFEDGCSSQNPGSAGVNVDVTFIRRGTAARYRQHHVPSRPPPAYRQRGGLRGAGGREHPGQGGQPGHLRARHVLERQVRGTRFHRDHQPVAPPGTWRYRLHRHGFEEWVLISRTPIRTRRRWEVAFMKTDGTVVQVDAAPGAGRPLRAGPSTWRITWGRRTSRPRSRRTSGHRGAGHVPLRPADRP